MTNNAVTTNATETRKAAILTFIGIFGSLLLKLFTIIGEASFITLTLVSVGVGLIIYFEKTIQSFKFGLSGVEATRVLDAIVAKETEPEPPNANTIIVELGGFDGEVEAYGTDVETNELIKAFARSQYTWRYLDSLVSESNLTIDTVKDKLNWLIINNLATEYDGVGGKVYALSPKGKSVFSSIMNS